MDRFGLGSWVLLIAVLLALASIVSAFTQFFRYMLRAGGRGRTRL